MTEAEPRSSGSIVRAAPGLARIAAAVSLRTAGWAFDASINTASRVVRAAASGEPPSELLGELGSDLRDYARRVLGFVEDGAAPPESRDEALRRRGGELLRRSADVHEDDELHPAYERILDSLSPDDARILRLLWVEGAQPAVDVRARKGLAVTSELVAPGLTMIGPEAGCRHLDRVPAYLNNLYRLGLLWFSREPLEDPLRYQVLEAQPDVLEAMEGEDGRGRTVRRSIHLTPFGEDFCRAVLPGQASSD